MALCWRRRNGRCVFVDVSENLGKSYRRDFCKVCNVSLAVVCNDYCRSEYNRTSVLIGGDSLQRVSSASGGRHFQWCSRLRCTIRRNVAVLCRSMSNGRRHRQMPMVRRFTVVSRLIKRVPTLEKLTPNPPPPPRTTT